MDESKAFTRTAAFFTIMGRERASTEDRIDGTMNRDNGPFSGRFTPNERILKAHKPSYKWIDTNRDGTSSFT